MLVVHMPDDADHKFFIPAAELRKRGFFTDYKNGAQGWMTLTVGASNHWTLQFLKGSDELIVEAPADDLAAPDVLPAMTCVNSLLPPATLPAATLPAQLVADLGHHHSTASSHLTLLTTCTPTSRPTYIAHYNDYSPASSANASHSGGACQTSSCSNSR